MLHHRGEPIERAAYVARSPVDKDPLRRSDRKTHRLP